MTLSRQVIDFARLNVVDQVAELPSIVEVSIMEKKLTFRIMRIRIDVVYPLCVERARSPNEAMNFIALLQKKLGKITTILPGDACD
jgi:hypothetical protein